MSAAYRSAIAAQTPVGSDRNGVPLSSRSACSTTAIAQRSRKPTRYERDERVLGSYGLRPPGPLIRPPPGRWPVSTSTTPTLRIRTEVLQTRGRSRYLAAAGSSAEPGNILTIGRVRIPARECVCLSQTPISAKPLAGNLNPSLQMGDAAHPVRIYFLGCNPWARHHGSHRKRNHQADRAGVSGAGTICSRKVGRDYATAGPAAGDAGSGGDLERQPTGPRRSKGLLHMATTALNHWAVFRFGLSYPDERHLERFAELCENVPGTLPELQSLYINLFEAGMPQPRCPLLESAWLLNRPAGDVV